MDTLKSILFALVAGVVASLSVLALTPHSVVEQRVGALSGPDISSPWLRWGGVTVYKAQTTLTTATSTPCAIQSPAATSTLVRTIVRITDATSTATTWTVAKATTAYATTTLLGAGQFSLSSGVQGVMNVVGTSTSATVDSDWVFAPNTYVVWGASGFVPAGTTKLLGTCLAEFTAL